MATPRGAGAPLGPQLREVYEQFSAFGRSRSVTPEEKAGLRQISDQGRSLDGTRFAKLCRDAGLVGSGKSKPSASAVELAFAKVKPKVSVLSRSVGGEEHLGSLRHAAYGTDLYLFHFHTQQPCTSHLPTLTPLSRWLAASHSRSL